ncbi:hypothetical protein Hanom_Chr14g01249711 [Helianthus anomalus]
MQLLSSIHLVFISQTIQTLICLVYADEVVVVVGERLGVTCDPCLTPTLLIILCGIQVKGEYGWRRFVLDGRQGFTDYSTVVPLGRWRLGFCTSGRAKGLAAVE